MGDFGNDEYPQMVCVEAAQASQKTTVKAGEKLKANHTIAVMD